MQTAQLGHPSEFTNAGREATAEQLLMEDIGLLSSKRTIQTQILGNLV